jgi:geranylgeranyl pyrophosphate synthase
MLIAFAYTNAKVEDKKYLSENLGDPDLSSETIAKLQDILISCGAQDFVENRISDYLTKSLSALDSLASASEPKYALTELAILATKRTA